MNGKGKRSAADVLAEKPASFLELMAAAGTRDGREIVRELDKLYAADRLVRDEGGKYTLKSK
jgi:2,5-furandicarboxylate decarboxylase 1